MPLKQFVSELRKIENEIDLLEQQKKNVFRRFLRFIGFSIDRDIDQKLSECNLRITTLKKQIKDNLSKVDILINKCVRIKDSEVYLISSEKENILLQLYQVEKDLSYLIQSKRFDFEVKDKIITIEKCRLDIEHYNENLIEHLKKKYQNLFRIEKEPTLKKHPFGTVESYDLDDEQQEAVLTDDKYNLVIASAGTGKTEVLITRIRYLAERDRDKIKQEKILALAYTNSVVDDINRRLRKHNITKVDVKTFHGLAKLILNKAETYPAILNEEESKALIRGICKSKRKDDANYLNSVISFVTYFRDYKKIPFDSSESEYRQALDKQHDTIDKTRVKSRAEKEIYDFLFTHKINGITIKPKYEPILSLKEGEMVHSIKPDFFIKKYDLYFEHWALDKDGNMPQRFKRTESGWSEEEIQKYRKGMIWKKKRYSKNNIRLIETNGDEYDPLYPERFLGILKQRIIDTLRKKYKKSFQFTSMNYDEVSSLLWGTQVRDDDFISTNVWKFIRNAKVYGFTPDDIKENLSAKVWSPKQRTFGKLALIVYKDYEEKLKKVNCNDFEDRINNAVMELKKNSELCENIFDHILIDEFQDISKQRYELIKELLNQNRHCKLFCVGDDWQSIMGFAGSDLDFFVNFDKHFKIKPAETKIQTNYRSIKTIVEAGTTIIKKNTKQKQKNPVSYNLMEKKIGIIIIQIRNKSEYHKKMIQDCVKRIKESVQKGIPYNEILVLSRYKHTFGLFHPNVISSFKKKGIRFNTIHSCKGLEAKIVFILDMIENDYGFPSKIEDREILEPAKGQESFGIEEERRVFYVAITRAKEEVIIYTQYGKESRFLNEIKDYTDEDRSIGFIPSRKKEVKLVDCKVCGIGLHQPWEKMCQRCKRARRIPDL